jgi:hypothetical protein
MENSEPRADESTGQAVSISGIAENAKAGAVLTTGDGRTIFVEGLEGWDDQVLGTSLTLTGILRRKNIYPGIKVGGGLTSQGMSGTPLVLELSQPYRKEE